MKKMNKLVKGISLVGVVALTLFLATGCGNNEDANIGRIEIGESTPLAAIDFDADAYFVTSDYGNLTNQDAFDLMLENETAILSLLNLVDEVLLAGNVDIDQDSIDETWEEIQEMEMIEDMDEWLSQVGLNSVDDVMRILELPELRREAVVPTVNVTDEDVQEAFEQWFDPEEDDIDEVREDLYSSLVDQAVQETMQAELIGLRADNGFEIFNATLLVAYNDFVERFEPIEDVDTDDDVEEDEEIEEHAPYAEDGDDETFDDVELDEDFDAGFSMDVIGDGNGDIIARINDVDITIGQLFDAFLQQFGLATAFEELDSRIINANYTADSAAAEEAIAELREELGEDFDEIVYNAGFTTDEELFDYFMEVELRNVVFETHIVPTEERLRELHEEMDITAGASHILVDDHDFAVELIERLQAASVADFDDLFADLADEYSNDAGPGGDLGTWSRGRMVEEFDNAVFDDLAVGEFTQEPVQTQFGYHIIYKTSFNLVPTFEEAREELLEQELEMLRHSGGVDEAMMIIRRNANMEFTNPNLQARFAAILDTIN